MTLNRTRMTRIWLICADKAEKSGFFPLHPHNPRSILSLSDRLLDARFSRLKFVGCRFLEERNPWLHHRFGNVETCLRALRISYCQASHQFIFRHIQEVHFTPRPKLLCS